MEKQERTKEEDNLTYKVEGKRRKRNKKKKRIGLKIFIFILVLLLIGGKKKKKRVHDLEGNWLAAIFGHNKNTLENLDKLYVLAMGESTGMSDTIIVFSYDPKTQEASMLSIPRDTFIGDSKRNARTSDKINSLYNNGRNPEKTLEAVNEITGLDIKNYVLIDTEALVELVDTIGGVEFNVPMDMKYDDYSQDLHVDLREGWQKLNGDQVEQLVRFRHSNPDANGKMTTYPSSYGADDYGRMRTQREFMKATATQLASWKNVGKIKDITTAVFDNLETDMKLTQIISYIPSMLKLNTETLRMDQLPGVSDQINEIWFYLANTDDTCELVNELMLSLQLDEAELAKMYTPIKDMPIVADNKEIAGTANNKNEVK